MKIRVIGDVHGEAEKLQEIVDEALKLERFIFFEGDVICKGPDSLGVMDIVVNLVKQGLAKLIAGNWEKVLKAAPLGIEYADGSYWSHYDEEINKLLKDVENAGVEGQKIFDDFMTLIENSYAWIVLGKNIFVHAIWDKKFLKHGLSPKLCELTKEGRNDFGYACTGHKNYTEDEDFEYSPISRCWIDELEAGEVAYVGHVSVPEILTVEGAKSGRAVYLDTGSGKKRNGYISYRDLDILD